MNEEYSVSVFREFYYDVESGTICQDFRVEWKDECGIWQNEIKTITFQEKSEVIL